MNQKSLKRGWVTLGLWGCGMLLLHIINRIFYIKINSVAMFICSAIAIIMILLINRFYTHEKIHFEWFGFQRIKWLICDALIFILITNATFKTFPSETALIIDTRPFFWLFFTLASAIIPVITFYGVLLPAMVRNWSKKPHRLLKSLLLSSSFFSLFEVITLHNLSGGLIPSIYQISVEFTFGILCGLMYLRSVNIIVAILFGFIETFNILVVTHQMPLWGNGIINIILLIVMIIFILWTNLRPMTINQIEKDFEIDYLVPRETHKNERHN